jgi:hypothetical protein
MEKKDQQYSVTFTMNNCKLSYFNVEYKTDRQTLLTEFIKEEKNDRNINN